MWRGQTLHFFRVSSQLCLVTYSAYNLIKFRHKNYLVRVRKRSWFWLEIPVFTCRCIYGWRYLKGLVENIWFCHQKRGFSSVQLFLSMCTPLSLSVFPPFLLLTCAPPRPVFPSTPHLCFSGCPTARHPLISLVCIKVQFALQSLLSRLFCCLCPACCHPERKFIHWSTCLTSSAFNVHLLCSQRDIINVEPQVLNFGRWLSILLAYNSTTSPSTAPYETQVINLKCDRDITCSADDNTRIVQMSTYPCFFWQNP